MDALGVQDERA